MRCDGDGFTFTLPVLIGLWKSCPCWLVVEYRFLFSGGKAIYIDRLKVKSGGSKSIKITFME